MRQEKSDERLTRVDPNNCELIKVSEFAERICVGPQTAYKMSKSKVFEEKRIAVNTNVDQYAKMGGIRINWVNYCKWLSDPDNSAVPEYKRSGWE